MNEERENGRFDPADFIPADAQPKAAVSCELEEPPRGSALTGILGALFGALVGVVPWFLASTFADFFVGWLGFLVGVAACWGYRLFKGRRSTRFAMATVIVCSLLALFAAEIASWMYVLCSDPEWQADAAWYGIPVAQLAWESILMPENWGIMAPSMLMGMVIGVLGVVCVKQKVLAYTDPERAAQMAAHTAQNGLASSAAQTAQANAAAGFAVPQSFTVRDKKWVRVTVRIVGVLIAVFFTALLAGVIGSSIDEPEGWSLAETVGFSAFALVFAVFGVFLIFLVRRRLVVEDGVFSYLPTFGRSRAFRLADIAGMTIGTNGRRLVGQDGRMLARFEDNQENSAILLQYLSEHGVGLLVK